MGTEKRQHERFAFPHPIEVRRDNDPSWIPAMARDISVGGLGFESDHPLEVGDRLRIGWPSIDEDIVFEAVVRHVRTSGSTHCIGVEGGR